MLRPIAISLSPNTEKDDLAVALKVLFSPWKWFDWGIVERFEKEFASIFGKNYSALAIDSGRSAWYLILKALDIGKGDQVAIQPFTCVVVVNPILCLGAKPLYVDIDDSYNVDSTDLKNKLNEKVKVVLVQHTFGIPARIDKIKKVTKGKKIFIVEDCAHCLGASFKKRPLGTIGDVSFFSFGRDKVLSSIFGGVILLRDKRLYERLRDLRDRLPPPKLSWILKQLIHPILFSIILPTYRLGFGKFSLGKIILFLFRRIGLISPAVSEEEKEGKMRKDFVKKFAPCLAFLALNQMQKLKKFNIHRRKIAEFYFKSLNVESLTKKGITLPRRNKDSIWLRFCIRIPKAEEFLSFAKRRGILLGNWYRDLISPAKELENLDYPFGSCPRAEFLSEEVVNLPTYPTFTLKDANKVVDIIKLWLATL